MKFHYNVHVISALDFSMWVGVTIDHKCDPSGNFCPNDSDLGQAAIARAKALCPSVFADWKCEEWNGGDRVAETAEEQFLGMDYAEKMAVLKEAAKPLIAALDKTGMGLCVDSRLGQHFRLTAIPRYTTEDGSLPYDLDPDKLIGMALKEELCPQKDIYDITLIQGN